MSVRMTVEIPDSLHESLKRRAEQSGTSIRALIAQAIEQTYREKPKGERVTGPLIQGPRERGPAFPTDENPHDLVFV